MRGYAELVESVRVIAQGDDSLPPAAGELVVAALAGDGELERALAGNPPSPAERSDQATAAPLGAYLAGITVQGFRGIGAQVRVPLHPSPGLTVIAGRNGCGKSSVAEAMELALTGSSSRFDKARAQQIWTSNWRNLHDGTNPEIRLELAQTQAGTVTIGVDWAPEAELGEQQAWVKKPGAERFVGRAALGWAEALEIHRPMLTYDELGGLLNGKQSELYDHLHRLLGLEPIVAAQQRLSATLKAALQPGLVAKEALKQARTAADAVDVPRALIARELLKGRKIDQATVRELVTGSAFQAPDIGHLRSLAELDLPTTTQVTTAAAALRTVVGELAAVAESAEQLSAARSELLERALAVHADHGDMTCPVCNLTWLNDDWAASARTQLDHDRSALDHARAAVTAVTSARAAVKALIDSVAVQPHPQVPPAAAAAALVDRWRRPPTGDLALADHLEQSWPALATELAATKAAAAELITTRDDTWAPVAVLIADWLAAQGLADRADPQAALLKVAATWLNDRAEDLRNQRLEPLADRARLIWAQLRQESNVELGSVRLEGRNTTRKVALLAEVDGAPAGALGVMSQGELHALALALFIPRATVDESPFRFLVLDDPIQAMDPAKIEGFVQVLAELAKDRQVIVFSHDDRLPQAIRRAEMDARLYEISRGPRSVVTVRPVIDPASRHLADAYAIAADDGVPDSVKARVVPGLCRLGLEAAAFDLYGGRAVAAGVTWNQVENRWADAPTLRKRLALAIFNSSTATAEVREWLSHRPATSRAVVMADSGTHSGNLGGDQLECVKDARTAVNDLRATR